MSVIYWLPVMIGSQYFLYNLNRNKCLSTIAFGFTDEAQSEGFNETSLLVLPDGKILSFIRSSGSYEPSLGISNNNDTVVKMPCRMCYKQHYPESGTTVIN
jgi:hypothetical protein